MSSSASDVDAPARPTDRSGHPEGGSAWRRVAAPTVVVGTFAVACVVLLVGLQGSDRLSVTGDEPHYLVEANAIYRYHTVELTQAYADEAVSHELYPGRLVAGPPQTVQNERGMFSVHGPGVSVIVAVPLQLFGVGGARMAMLAVAGLGVLASWYFAIAMGIDRRTALIVVPATTIASAFLLSATQIYPDLSTGVFALLAALAVLQIQRLEHDRDALTAAVLGTIAAGFLPFLHIKAGVVAAWLVVCLLIAVWLRFRRIVPLLAVTAAAAGSALSFAVFTWHVYGNLRGPYTGPTLVWNEMAATVLAGLYVDQFQGLLAQAPLLLVGIASIVPFVRRFPLPGVALVGAHLGYMVPNGLHPAWYGGTSLAGRFAVAGAVLLVPPTMYGVAWLLARDRPTGVAVLAVAVITVIASSYDALFLDSAIFNNVLVVPGAYPSQFPWARGALPMLYQSEWAFSYLPNLVGIALVVVVPVVVAVISFTRPRRVRRPARVVAGIVAAAAAVAVVGARVGEPEAMALAVCPCNMAAVTGAATTTGFATSAEPGIIAFGPFAVLDEGRHEISFQMDVTEPGRPIGHWEVGIDGGEAYGAGVLPGDTGRHLVRVPVDVPAGLNGHRVEVRIFWSGQGAFEISDVMIDRP